MTKFNVLHKVKDIKSARVTLLVIVIVLSMVALLAYGIMTTNQNTEPTFSSNEKKSKIDRSDNLEATAMQWSMQKADNPSGSQKQESDSETNDASAPISKNGFSPSSTTVPPIDQDTIDFNRQVAQLQQEEKLKRMHRQYDAYNSRTLVYSRDIPNTANSQNNQQNESGTKNNNSVVPSTNPTKLVDNDSTNNSGTEGIKTYTPDYKLGNNYSLIATTIIPAVLLSELVSDNSGPVSAMVSDNIYDTQTYHQLLIPQGSKLIGFYSGNVAYGSNRIDVAFRQLCFPNGQCIDLAQEPATDVKGSVGLHDLVDNHYWELFGMNFIGSVITSGSNYAQSQAANGSGITPSTGDVAQNMGQTTNQVLQSKVKTSPTITIRQASVIRIMLTNNMVLKPYNKNGVN